MQAQPAIARCLLADLEVIAAWLELDAGGRRGQQPQAISAAAKRGEALFFGEKMECYHCHGGFTFNDNVQHLRLPLAESGFHNTGLYNIGGTGNFPAGNQGLFEITERLADRGKFRAQSLRNVEVTGPYMHDGSVTSLEQVIRIRTGETGQDAL